MRRRDYRYFVYQRKRAVVVIYIYVRIERKRKLLGRSLTPGVGTKGNGCQG
jgi:hypothetical protein